MPDAIILNTLIGDPLLTHSASHVLPVDPILAETDRCVKCGLCLPKCPTYGLFRDEAESPRGRIALLQGLVGGGLAPSQQMRAHLDHCLACRACEAACPSGVRYGRLIDMGRERLVASRPPARRLAMRGLLGLLTRRLPLHVAGALLPALQGVVARWPAIAGSSGVGGLMASIPRLGGLLRWRAVYPAAGTTVRRVNLFTGCVAGLLDANTLLAGVEVLNRLGWEVAVPPAQGCCGAMHYHAGYAGRSRALARANLAAFSDEAPIVSMASGCAAQLVDYPDLFDAGEADEARALAARVQDISAFLAEVPWPEPLRVKPLQARVAVHDPCTLRNVLAKAEAPAALLRCIPGVEIVPLPGNGRCCGAAGTYTLTEPAIARRLRDAKIEELRAAAPDMVVSSNIGCALHLRAGLHAAGLDIEVLHPVQLLARQL